MTEPDKEGVVWPLEEKLRAAGRFEEMRQPMPLEEMQTVLAAFNEQLKALGEPPLELVEAFGARL